jgi:hypothetical protein
VSDWQALLRKYTAYVEWREGTHFISPWDKDEMVVFGLTSEEAAALIELTGPWPQPPEIVLGDGEEEPDFVTAEQLAVETPAAL